MKNSTIAIIVLILILIAAYFLFTSNDTNDGINTDVTPSGLFDDSEETDDAVLTPTGTSTSDADRTSSTSTLDGTTSPVSVMIRDFTYYPESASARVGNRVTWINNDTVPHTVTSRTGALLDSPVLAPGQSYSHTFTSAGTFNYYCKLHPMMIGSVTVTE